MAERDTKPARAADRWDIVSAADPMVGLPSEVRMLVEQAARLQNEARDHDEAAMQCRSQIRVLLYKARAHGVSMRRLGRALGLSYARVQQLTHEYEAERAGLPRSAARR